MKHFGPLGPRTSIQQRAHFGPATAHTGLHRTFRAALYLRDLGHAEAAHLEEDQRLALRGGQLVQGIVDSIRTSTSISAVAPRSFNRANYFSQTFPLRRCKRHTLMARYRAARTR